MVQNFGGSVGSVTNVYGYEQNPALKTVVSSSVENGALKVDFQLKRGQDWAGVLVTTRLQQGQLQKGGASTNLQDLAAEGTGTLRIEVGADGFETADDNPQVRLNVSPGLTTYRLPISAFRQAGWGKAVNVADFLKKASSVSVFADTVGTQGRFVLDNVVLERK